MIIKTKPWLKKKTLRWVLGIILLADKNLMAKHNMNMNKITIFSVITVVVMALLGLGSLFLFSRRVDVAEKLPKSNSIDIIKKDMTKNETVFPKKDQKYDIKIHKIAGLGDFVRDSRSYDEACKGTLEVLGKKYNGILKFDLLEGDYKKEGNKNIFRFSAYMGGQYSCYFGGKYVHDIANVEFTGTSMFHLKEFNYVGFTYPELKGFKSTQKYNDKKKAGEIVFAPTYRIAEPVAYKFPTLIVEKKEHATKDYSIDEIKTNRFGVKYKIWDDHDQSNVEPFLNDIYQNMDTTIEIRLSEKEVFYVSTVNFIWGSIPEAQVLSEITESFRTIKNY